MKREGPRGKPEVHLPPEPNCSENYTNTLISQSTIYLPSNNKDGENNEDVKDKEEVKKKKEVDEENEEKEADDDPKNLS